MALIETKCPNCGANIVVDGIDKKLSCIYCHANFSLANDETGASDNSRSQELDVLDRAETFLSVLGKPQEALKLFDEYALLEPADYQGWWGIARAYSNDFTDKDCDEETYAQIEENVNLALRVAGDKAEELRKIWEDYKLLCSDVSDTCTPPKTSVAANVPENVLEEYRTVVAEIEKEQSLLSEKRKEYEKSGFFFKSVKLFCDIIQKIWEFIPLINKISWIYYIFPKKRREICFIERKIKKLKKTKSSIEKKYRLNESMI